VRAVVQRVTEASVRVDGELVGAIGAGLGVLVGVTHDDGPAEAVKLAAKLWNPDHGRRRGRDGSVGGRHDP